MNVEKIEANRASHHQHQHKAASQPPSRPSGPLGFLSGDLQFVFEQDELLRATIKVLRERHSLLLLDLDESGLQRQEEEAAAELYPSLCSVAHAKREEERAKYALEEAEKAAYAEAQRESGGKLRVADVKGAVAGDVGIAQAREVALEALHRRRLAEAYVEALKVKLTLLPGSQGARNRQLR